MCEFFSFLDAFFLVCLRWVGRKGAEMSGVEVNGNGWIEADFLGYRLIFRYRTPRFALRMTKRRRGRLRFPAGAHRYSPGIGMAEVADDYAKALRALCVQPIIRYAILLEI